MSRDTLICCSIFNFNLTFNYFIFIIFFISGEDGRSRAEQLLHILRQIDPYVSSSVDYQRKRGCLAAYEMLQKFRTICVSGYCALGCHGSCNHNKRIDRALNNNFSNLPSRPLSLSHTHSHGSSVVYKLKILVFLSRICIPKS